MAFGIRAYNGSGYTQIDQDYANYIVWTTGTTWIIDTSDTQAGFATVGPAIGIADIGVYPMVFIRNPGVNYIGLHSVNTNFVRFCKDRDEPPNGAPYYFDYMICYPASHTVGAQPGFGAEIYTAGGAVAFSSNVPYTRVQDVLQVPGVGWPTTLAFSAPIGNPWMLVSNIFGTRYTGDTTYMLGYGYYIGLRAYASWYVQLASLLVDGGMGYSPDAADTVATIAILKN